MKRLLLVLLVVGCGQDIEKDDWTFQEPEVGVEVEVEPDESEPNPELTPEITPEPVPALPIGEAPNSACEGRLPVTAGDQWYTYDLRASRTQFQACPLEGSDAAQFYSLDFEGYENLRISIWPEDPEVRVSPSLQVIVDGIARHYPQCQSEPELLECVYFYDGLGRGNSLEVVVPRPDSLPLDELESAKATLVLSHYGQCLEGQSCKMIMTVIGAD